MLKIAAGSSGTPIALEADEAPAPGDSITVMTNTKRLKVALITPRGERITISNAADAGLDWRKSDNGNPPLGSTDGGHFIHILFKEPALAGRYTVLFTSETVETAAMAGARFTSRKQEHRQLVQSIPGAQMPNPVPIGANASMTMDLVKEMDGLLDVVVPDSTVDVSLIFPDGRVLRQQQAAEKELEWKVMDNPEDPKAALSWLANLGLLLPRLGTHHVIWMRGTPKGRYEIRAAQSGKAEGEMSAVFFPWQDAVKAAWAKVDPGRMTPGELRLQPTLSCSQCFAGETVDLAVGLAGEPGPEPPSFQLRIEHSPSNSDGRVRRIGPPGPVKTLPVKFARGTDGQYHGAVVLPGAGRARVEVRASGTRPSGEAYAAQAIVLVFVNPLVARVVSLESRGVDGDGDGKFDRLDTTADLDVSLAGEFWLNAAAVDATRRRVASVSTAETLGVGRQRLTAVIRAGKVWNELRDGPLEIKVWIAREGAPGAASLPVQGAEGMTRSILYHREQWDHGPLYGEDEVSVHGIRPAPTGRFTIAEVEWNVTTPGGACGWTAALSAVGGGTTLQAKQSGEVPSGRHKFSFLFDGGAIAAAGKRAWKFDARVECGGRSAEPARAPALALDLDFGQYEPAGGALSIEAPVPLQSERTGSWLASLRAAGKGAATAQFKLTKVPEGLNALLREAGPGQSSAVNLVVNIAPGIPPGRYFIGVAAISGEETVNREFVLDLPGTRSNAAESRVVTLPGPASARVAPGQSPSTGPAKASVRPAGTSGVETPRIRVAASVQAKKLVRQPTIEYPALAGASRIEGVVRFAVVTRADGTIQNLQLLGGHPLLIPAAQKAVRQWVYTPTLVNGVPAEVITQVEVNFRLPQVEE